MTTDNAQRSVLLIGKSQLVLDESVAGLRDLGYRAEATNDFSDITGRFDVNAIDLVVFGGQVPADRKAELTEEFAAINPGSSSSKDWPASQASSSTRSGARSQRASKTPRTQRRTRQTSGRSA
jgi:hypothetical protein